LIVPLKNNLIKTFFGEVVFSPERAATLKKYTSKKYIYIKKFASKKYIYIKKLTWNEILKDEADFMQF
jgi:hypothetical protein